MTDNLELLDLILPRLDRGGATDRQWPDHNGEYWARCPFHNDQNVGSFSLSERGYTCFSCGAAGGLVKLAQHLGVDLSGCRVARLTEGVDNNDFSLAAYAQAKRLPVQFLKTTFSLTERKRGERVAVRMPYFDKTGAELCVRYRIAMVGDKFRWAKGAKLHLYGLWLLDPAAPDVVLVEGESDVQTLIYHGIPALGVPGATNWRREWAEVVAGKLVYAWQEPDEAGAQFVGRIAHDLPDVRVIKVPGGCE